MGKRKVTAEQIEALAKKGHQSREIAERLGVCTKTVRRVAKSHGIALARTPAPTQKIGDTWTTEEDRDLIRLLRRGDSYEDIGVQLSRTASAIGSRVHVLGGRAKLVNPEAWRRQSQLIGIWVSLVAPWARKVSA